LISIIDYNAGNIRSIVNMLRALGQASTIVTTPEQLASAEKLILPGVGHFDYGMRELTQRGLVDALTQRVMHDKIPLLGICLGAQLLMQSSEEGASAGLGWIAGRSVGFDKARLGTALRVPHMGWSDTWALRQHPLTRNMTEAARFYYVHSFHLQCDSPETALFMATHGYEFVAGVCSGSVAGVQFHPEKSHRFGMQILRNFIAWDPRSEADEKSVA
jgi:imidazole glycerol-phosphate synthase subunit HisH